MPSCCFSSPEARLPPEPCLPEPATLAPRPTPGSTPAARAACPEPRPPVTLTTPSRWEGHGPPVGDKTEAQRSDNWPSAPQSADKAGPSLPVTLGGHLLPAEGPAQGLELALPRPCYLLAPPPRLPVTVVLPTAGCPPPCPACFHTPGARSAVPRVPAPQAGPPWLQLPCPSPNRAMTREGTGGRGKGEAQKAGSLTARHLPWAQGTVKGG